MPYISSIEQIGRQEGRQEGRQDERQEFIKSLLRGRFSTLDDALSSVIEPLAKLPSDEIANLLLTSSLEEILALFGQSTVH